MDYGKLRWIIDRVQQAALNRRSIKMVYYTMSRKSETCRKVDSFRLWFFNGTFYLIGRCHIRNEVGIFSLDRIKMLHQTRDNFKIPADFKIEDFINSSFGVFQGESIRTKVLFSAEVAGYIKEKTWHETQEIHQQEDGSILFEAQVAGKDEIKFWVMSWGSHALVLWPDSLREEIRTEVEKMAKNYCSDQPSLQREALA